MRALLVRHAIAENPAAWGAKGRSDLERPLTDEGRKRMRRIAATLARLEPELELILTSPALRAAETAAILAAHLPGDARVVEAPALAPDGRTAAALTLLRAQSAHPVVALVGHEPNLSLLAGAMLAGSERSLVVMKKGSAALFEFPGRVTAGGARLLWHLPPALLRRLGD